MSSHEGPYVSCGLEGAAPSSLPTWGGGPFAAPQARTISASNAFTFQSSGEVQLGLS